MEVVFMNLLITSSFPQKNNELIAQHIKKLGKNLQILYVGFTENARKYCEKVKEYGFPNVDFIDLTKGINSEELSSYDVIMNHGGNPFRIKEKMNRSGYSEFFLTAKALIITTSGSSLVLSKNFELYKILYPKMKGRDSEGLGLFPFEVIPHYQRYSKKEGVLKNYSKGKKSIYNTRWISNSLQWKQY